jgi:hypothetical protein
MQACKKDHSFGDAGAPTTVLVGTATLYMSNKSLPRQNELFLNASADVVVL